MNIIIIASLYLLNPVSLLILWLIIRNWKKIRALSRAEIFQSLVSIVTSPIIDTFGILFLVIIALFNDAPARENHVYHIALTMFFILLIYNFLLYVRSNRK